MKKKMLAGLMTFAMVGVLATPITAKADTWVDAGSGSFSTSSDGTITYTMDSSSSSSSSSTSGSSEAYTSSGSTVDWSTTTIKDLKGIHGTAGSINGNSIVWSISEIDSTTLPTGITENTLLSTIK